MGQKLARDTFIVIFSALILRLLSVVITTITSLNTYSHGDVSAFASAAAYIADGIRQGVYTLPPNYSSTDHTWGTFLAPFWLIPGPSRIYARIGIAVLGAIAVYNVYIIVRHYHSKYAGAIAILPMLFYPSFLFLHAVVLREAMVLFGLTTAARLLLVPGPRMTNAQQYFLASFFLGIATVLREDNLPIYLFTLAVAAVFKLQPWHQYERLLQVFIGIGAAVSPVFVVRYGRDVLDQLLFYRRVRARGRTAYLGSVFPDTIPKAIVFSWIGAAYFLFTPFPWMISQLMDFVIAFEGLANVIYTIAMITGARVLAQKTLPGTMALVVGIIVGAVLYGLGTVNVGTAVRHRQMLLWAIFLLGGIGLAEHISIRLPERDT